MVWNTHDMVNIYLDSLDSLDTELDLLMFCLSLRGFSLINAFQFHVYINISHSGTIFLQVLLKSVDGTFVRIRATWAICAFRVRLGLLGSQQGLKWFQLAADSFVYPK